MRTVWVVIAVAVLGSGVWFLTRSTSGSDAEFARLMNLGQGYIENRETAQAVETLTRAVETRPESAPALRNLARAHLIPKREENYQAAVACLNRAMKIEPESSASSYLMGLALSGLERYEESLPFFEKAVALDPNTSALRYQFAYVLQIVGDQDRAYEQLLETVRLQPLHIKAIYNLSRHAARRKDREEAIRLTNEFRRLKELFGTQPDDIFQRCTHTRPESAPTKQPEGTEQGIPVVWTNATSEVFASEADRSATTAAVIEVLDDGTPVVVSSASDGSIALLSIGASGKFERTEILPPNADRPGFRAAAVGDFYVRIPSTGSERFTPRRTARNDVFFVGDTGCLLLERVDDTTFVDRTLGSGLEDVHGAGAIWVDYDHNGILDLFVESGLDGAQLWQNNSYVIRVDSTGQADEAMNAESLEFINVSEIVGLNGLSAAYEIAAADVDGNLTTDLIVAGAEGTSVYLNTRAGTFKPMPSPPGPWQDALQFGIDDLNNDGYTDILLINPFGSRLMYGNSNLSYVFDHTGFLTMRALLCDFDNDGRQDIIFCGVDSTKKRVKGSPHDAIFSAYRNLGANEWTNVTTATRVDQLAIKDDAIGPIAGDFDNDGDTDILLVTMQEKLHFIRNDGGNANGKLKIRLATILTNTTGLGNHIELRDGSFRVSRFVTKLPIEIGIGPHTQFDTVHTTWTNGVLDNEFLISATKEPIELVEKMVELGSCPFLFAWNGQRFQFVTDILGNAPIGLSIRRDEILPADPDEIVRVGQENELATLNGDYVLEVAECYREVLYLDSAELIAVDHPTNIEVHPTDKLMPPPFPVSQIVAVENLRPPQSVDSSDGMDRLEALQHIDDHYAPPGTTLPPPFRGLCHPMTLTMNFGPIDPDASNVLALTGWLRYGSASVNIAVEQNPSLDIIPPTLEVENATGEWIPVDAIVGMPAGKTKTILCDLTGKLPEGTRRLRLTSSFEIRWDRIALGTHATLNPSAIRISQPTSADLYHRGFPEMASRGNHHPITPDYDTITSTPKWKTTPQGWCTRYGDVLELLAAADEKIAILNGGDAVTLRYNEADFPPRDANLKRTFFFKTVGWEKDADYNVVSGDTVHPLPVTIAPNADWPKRFNTRYVEEQPFKKTPD